jgi:NTE family protein
VATFALATALAGYASRPANEAIHETEPYTPAIVTARAAATLAPARARRSRGGGTRAAAFSFGVLEELRRTTVAGPPPHRMLDEVDTITGVSGGSFTALSFALYGERLFTEYETRFLKRNVQDHLIAAALNPLNWADLASPR